MSKTLLLQDSIPSVYHGELSSNDLMHWILRQKSEDSILSLTGPMLEGLAERQNHLAVIFMGDYDRNEESSEQVKA